MKTYQAYFRTDTECAVEEFQADTAELALQLARAFLDDRADELSFEPYTDRLPVDEITIAGPGGEELRYWLDDDLRLRCAAPKMLEALISCAEQLEHYLCTCEPGKDDRASAALAAAREAISSARP